jgi:hypothetical protein
MMQEARKGLLVDYVTCVVAPLAGTLNSKTRSRMNRRLDQPLFYTINTIPSFSNRQIKDYWRAT